MNELANLNLEHTLDMWFERARRIVEACRPFMVFGDDPELETLYGEYDEWTRIARKKIAGGTV